jgi:2-polyprenyl-3-methyl-5-hydroxy-6-metoxy-1,4-benzoquinol methylase
MLHPLKEKGYDCFGIEPSGLFSRYLKKSGIKSFSSLGRARQSRDWPEKFDLIMHFFVLEHVEEPEKFLKEQLDCLSVGGSLIVEVPNCDDPLNKVYNIPEFQEFYWQVAHNWYFSYLSFNNLLKRVSTNVEILLDQRYDLSNHMIWARDGIPGGAGKFSKQLGEDFEKQYRKMLIQTGFCDTLVGILRN